MNKKTALPKQLTTVTPLSKALAMLLFIALPFVGFMLGREYGKYINIDTKQNTVISTPIKYKNEITKEIVNDYQVVKLKVYGKIVPLDITDMDIPYRYKIVLLDPITDTDVIVDASGLNKPKTEFVITSKDEKIISLLSNLGNKTVEIQGELEWGYAETRQLRVDSLKML